MNIFVHKIIVCLRRISIEKNLPWKTTDFSVEWDSGEQHFSAHAKNVHPPYIFFLPEMWESEKEILDNLSHSFLLYISKKNKNV